MLGYGHAFSGARGQRDEVLLDSLAALAELLAEGCLELDAEASLCYLQVKPPPALRLTSPELLMTDDIEAEITRLEQRMLNQTRQPIQSDSNRAREEFESRMLIPPPPLLPRMFAAYTRLRFDERRFQTFAGSCVASIVLLMTGWTVFRPSMSPVPSAVNQRHEKVAEVVASPAHENTLVALLACQSRRPRQSRACDSVVPEA